MKSENHQVPVGYVWVDLPEAAAFFKIRQFRNLSALAGVSARGRVGGPLKCKTEIPPTAWLHLSCKVENGDFLAITPEGTRIYDVQIALPLDDGRPTPADASTPPPVEQRASQDVSQEPADVFRRIAAQERPAGAFWTIEEYNDHLSKAGLCVKPDKQRVPRVSIGPGGKITRGTASISLHNLLLVSRFEVETERGGFAGFRFSRDIARELLRWLAADHGGLSAARGPIDDKALDSLVDDFRRRWSVQIRPQRDVAESTANQIPYYGKPFAV
ncbi:hypothetical protein [Pararhizobium arenae]|uniref:hypothetical protein n=1 Tax=Pararhizobium arenae TaxID=1856850 RepID=UPI000AD3B279|nr:hypothetical protein [Pararhizobium arenae]